MNLRQTALRIAGWLEHAAAAGFLTVAAVALALWFTGAVDRQRARAVWDLLRGDKVAVSRADSARLAAMDREVSPKTSVESDEQAAGEQAYQQYLEQKNRLRSEFEKERQQLMQFEKVLARREEQLSGARKQLEAQDAKLRKDREEFLAQKQKGSLQKILRLYAGMEAEDIARDLLQRLQGNKEEDLNEVVEILRNMQERQASEVLSAIAEPAVRVRLFAAMKAKT